MVGALGVTEAVVIVVVLVLCFTPAASTVAKGHVALFFAGLLLPDYGPDELQRSKRRYPDTEVTAPSRAGLAAAIGFGLLAAAVLAGAIAAIAVAQPAT